MQKSTQCIIINVIECCLGIHTAGGPTEAHYNIKFKFDATLNYKVTFNLKKKKNGLKDTKILVTFGALIRFLTIEKKQSQQLWPLNKE